MKQLVSAEAPQLYVLVKGVNTKQLTLRCLANMGSILVEDLCKRSTDVRIGGINIAIATSAVRLRRGAWPSLPFGHASGGWKSNSASCCSSANTGSDADQ